jgi:hypothetical protein
VRKWNKGGEAYGEHWAAGDIIGCFIDMDNKIIKFSRNGNDMGEAFKNIKTGEVRF